jgi:hypothetical protein
MILANLWVIVRPGNKGIFIETFSSSPEESWNEFYLGGVCQDAVDASVNCEALGYKAQKVAIVLEEK